MLLDIAIGDIPAQLIVSVPAAIAVIYVVRLFLASQKEWKDDLKSTVATSNGVIERNTDALIRIEGVLAKCHEKGIG